MSHKKIKDKAVSMKLPQPNNTEYTEKESTIILEEHCDNDLIDPDLSLTNSVTESNISNDIKPYIGCEDEEKNLEA